MARRKNGYGNVTTKPDGSFRVRLSVGGVKVDKVLKDMTRQEAEDWARDEARRLEDRKRQGLPGPMAFSALLQRFRENAVPVLAPNTQRTYRFSLNAFETYFVKLGKDPKAHEIGSPHVEGYLEWRRTHAPDGTKLETMLSARSVEKDRAVLHRVFRYAGRFGIVQSNPVSDTEKPTGDSRQPVILTGAEYEALLTACDDRPMLRMFVLLLGETGLRCESEALLLKWHHLDRKQNEVVVESTRKNRTKSGKGRRVPMTSRLREALQEHSRRFRMATYGKGRSEWVFHHETDRGKGTAGERVKSMRGGFESAVKRAEIPEDKRDLNQHDLRHRRVTTWLEAGHPIHAVQHAMGHSTVTVTEGYSHLTSRSLQQLVEDDMKTMKEAMASG